MNLGQILDVDLPTPSGNGNTDVQVLIVPDVSEQANNTTNQDAVEARNNLRQYIAQGNLAITELLNIARNTGTPRSYEVASAMLKTLSELNQDLMAVHQKELELQQVENGPEVGDVNIEQAVFVGSTSDLAEIIKKKKAERDAERNKTIEVKAERVVQDTTSNGEVLPQEPSA